MKKVLSGLEPKKVFEVFEEICAIPHGSGNTKAISDYCAGFARERGLWVLQDELNNVIIKKPASAGYENHPPVVLQGHLDMVCEKDPEIDFDFTRDALRLKLDGDILSATGTTLGGDDGVAVAIALGIIDDDTLPHPPLEVIFTSDEETGMYGAAGIDAANITAKRFISLDHGDDSSFTVGCAGGTRVEIELPLETAAAVKPAYRISVSGLTGGHSGEEIDKGRLNANKLLGSFLSAVPGDVRISSISGGNMVNAITVNASCVVCTGEDLTAAAKIFEKENRCSADKGLTVTVDPVHCDTAFTAESSKLIINLLCELPDGVQAMSADFTGVVETSLNIGVIKIENNAFHVFALLRSSKDNKKAELTEKIKKISERFGARCDIKSEYPAWEYKKDSPLRKTMVSVYEDMFGKTPDTIIIHGGLECGLFSGKIKDIDAVSTGPNLYDIHTAHESLSVSSLARIYKYICRVLEAL